MKTFVIAVMLFSLPLTVVADMDQYKADAKKITGAFFEELKRELGKGIKANAGARVLHMPIAATGPPAFKPLPNSPFNSSKKALDIFLASALYRSVSAPTVNGRLNSMTAITNLFT